MSWDKFKQRLQDEAKEQRSEVNPLEIWNAIESEVDAINSKRKKRGGPFYFSILMAVLVAAGGMYYLWSNNTSTTSTVLSDSTSLHENKKTIQKEQANLLPENQKQNNTTSNIEAEKNYTEKDRVENETEEHKTQLNTNKKEEQITQTVNEKRTEENNSVDISSTSVLENNNDATNSTIYSTQSIDIEGNTAPSPFTLEEKIPPIFIREKPNDTQKLILDKKERPSQKIKETNTKNTFSPTLPLASEIKLLNQNQIELPDALYIFNQLNTKAMADAKVNEKDADEDDEDAKRDSKKTFSYAIGIQGGVGMANKILESKNNDFEQLTQLRNDSETSLEFHQYGLQFSINHTSGFGLITGIQRTAIAERMDYTETTVEVDSIMGVQYVVNKFGEDTIHVMGLLPETTTTIFNKKIYNTYTLIDLPFLLSYQKKLDKWRAGIQAGIYANISLKTEGQIQEATNSFINIEEQQENVFRSNVGISYHVGVSVSRELTSNIAVEFSPYFRHFPTDFSVDAYGISQKYSLFGGKLGLSYRF